MVQYLDPEIANEGIKVVPGANGALEEGEEYQPFVEEPHIPDYKSFKTPKHPLSKYFRPYKHKAFPAIFYRADGATKMVSSIEDATKLGCRLGTAEEGFRWHCTGEWVAKPFAAHTKFDSTKLGTGKAQPPPTQTEAMSKAIADALKSVQSGASAVTDQVSTIVAAVIAAMKMIGAPAAVPEAPVVASAAGAAEAAKPAPVAAAPAPPPAAEADPLDIPLALRRTPTVELSAEEKKKLLIEAAEEKGVKIDKRWSFERITQELENIPD